MEEMERTKSLRGGHRRSDRAARASSRSSPAAPRSAPAGRTTRLRSQPLSRVAPAVAIHRTTRIRTRTRTRHIERHAHPRYKKTAATQRRTHTEMPGGRSSGATASAERQHRGATAFRGRCGTAHPSCRRCCAAGCRSRPARRTRRPPPAPAPGGSACPLLGSLRMSDSHPAHLLPLQPPAGTDPLHHAAGFVPGLTLEPAAVACGRTARAGSARWVR